MITYLPIDFSEDSFIRYSDFLVRIFNKTKPKSTDYLKWEYINNPAGPALGFDAFEDNNLIGHYVAQPIRAFYNGEIRKGLFALHVAVDERFRGRGIFAEINQRTHSLAKNSGYEFVIGVANKSSTYVYTQKLGFSLIGSLITKAGFGLPHAESTLPGSGNFYAREWSDEFLQWRLMNPNNDYSYVQTSDGIYILGKTHIRGIKVLLTIVPGVKEIQMPLNVKKGRKSTFIVWYGCNNSLIWDFRYFSIPERLKPAPLNLIFLDLSNQGELHFSPDTMLFNPIDHDAF
jgi:hypothetical protein